MTGVLSAIDALRSEVDTLRAQAATIAREHAILTEHADALEGALSTIAGAVGASWDDGGVAENTARVTAAIADARKAERGRCAAKCRWMGTPKNWCFDLGTDACDAADSCARAIEEMTDDQR